MVKLLGSWKAWAALSAALLAPALSQAETLTPEQALERALTDSNIGAAVQRAASKSQPVLAATINTPAGSPAIYCFTTSADAEGSYLIIGANDLLRPVLGYGSRVAEGVEMPPQMVTWLKGYAAELAYADSVMQAAPSRRRLAKPEAKAQRSPRQAINPLLTTEWNQGAPYNALTPEYNGEHTWTGCVATALAQVMNYHKYPEAGTGTGQARLNGNYIGEMDLDFPLDWTNMNVCNYELDGYTPEQAEAVAKLMIGVGYACDMNYSTDGSGAYDANAARAMRDNYSYSPSTWLYYRDYYTLEDWTQMLYTNLANVGPMYYSGQASGGGHAFVCDGYDGNEYFHFNWGWGGWYDGFFAIDALDPAGQGAGGFEGGYNTNQQALLGMQAPTEGAQTPTMFLYQSEELTYTVEGQYISLSSFWQNLEPYEESFDLNFELENMADGSKTLIYDGVAFEGALPTWYGYTGFNSYLPSYLAEGDYQLRVVYRRSATETWLYPMSIPGQVNCAEIRFDGESWSDINAAGEAEIYADSLELNSPLYYEEPAALAASLTNIGSVDGSINIWPVLINEDYQIMSSAKYYYGVEVAAGETKVVTMECEFNYYDGFELDTPYELVLVDYDTYYIIASAGEVTVTERPVQEFDVTTFAVDAESLQATPEATRFDVTLTPSLDYDGIFTMIVTNAATHDFLTVASTDSISIAAGEQLNFSIIADLSKVAPNTEAVATLYDSDNNAIALTEFVKSSNVAISGVAAEPMALVYNPLDRTLRATAASGIAKLTLTDAAGRQLPVAPSIAGTTAVANLSSLPRGLVIATLTAADGTTLSRKIALR